MNMLARLKYLYDEGFEVTALSGYDDQDSEFNAKILYFNAKILYLKRSEEGPARVCSELFRVDAEEMEQCCKLFFSCLPGRF